MGLVDVNTTAIREDMAGIERGICLLKGRFKSVVKSLPFWYFHKQIVDFMVHFVTMFVNAVWVAGGISQEFSPGEIVTQQKTDFKNNRKAQFGVYVEASTDVFVTIDTKSRTHECIESDPSGNWQGLRKCFDLCTWKVVMRRTVEEVHMPDGIKKLAEKWGFQSGGKVYNCRVEFLNHTKDEFEWEIDDISMGGTIGEEKPIYPNLIAEILGVELETDFEDMKDTVQ